MGSDEAQEGDSGERERSPLSTSLSLLLFFPLSDFVSFGGFFSAALTAGQLAIPLSAI